MAQPPQTEVAPGQDIASGAERRSRLLYLTTEYPHISHTFIRREIQGLEALGYEIDRVAMHAGVTAVDAADQAEAAKTVHLLAQSKAKIALQILKGARLAGLRIVPALRQVLTLSGASDRSFLRHLAYWLEALMLRAIAGKRDIQHIHVHFGTNAATVAYLTRLMGGPRYSVMMHGPVEFDQPYGQSLTLKLSAASFVAAITDYCRSQIFRWLPHAQWTKVHVVPCTVGEEWFAAAEPLTPNHRDLVCVGRLDEQKGQIFLIDAFAAARAAGFDGRLLLIGDGPFREAIERRIEAHQLGDSVVLTGWQSAEQIRAHISAARALILASFAEGLPVVIMEAMAMQRPILSTRITGIPELVRDGQEGFLYTPANTDELTAAILRLAETDVDTLAQMGAQAQARVRERHLTEVAVRRLDRLIQDSAAES